MVCWVVQRGIGAHTFEELEQKVAAIKAKTAVNVTTKKPAEANLEVLATPDQTPGPTPAHTRAPSRSNSECLDSSISAQVMCSEPELNCEFPRGSSSSCLEDEQLQVGADFTCLFAVFPGKYARPAFIFCQHCSVPARRR